MASWALLIQFLMCLLLPVVTGTTYKTDSLDGEESATKEPTDSKWGNYVCITIRYIALIFLYSGMVMVIVSVFLITPETRTVVVPSQFWVMALFQLISSRVNQLASTTSQVPRVAWRLSVKVLVLVLMLPPLLARPSPNRSRRSLMKRRQQSQKPLASR